MYTHIYTLTSRNLFRNKINILKRLWLRSGKLFELQSAISLDNVRSLMLTKTIVLDQVSLPCCIYIIYTVSRPGTLHGNLLNIN